MNYVKLPLIMLGANILCTAATPEPYHWQYQLLKRISAVAVSQSPLGSTAIRVLKEIALGQAVPVNLELEGRIASNPGELQHSVFRKPEVRARAFRMIGSLGTPDSVEFLRRLTPADIGPDDSQAIWPAAQIALQEARLLQISDSQARTEFLEKTIKAPTGGAIARGKVSRWAVEELCNNGIITSLPVIREDIWKRDPFEGGKQIQFCEARMQVIRRHPDRARALGSVLKADSSPGDQRLMWWAIYQLASLQSPEADAELDRYRAEIDKLPEGSPAKRQAAIFRQTIRDLQAQSQANAIR